MKYEALIPDVLVHLTGDPSFPLTENTVRATVIEFCRRSWIWRAYSDPIDIEAGNPEYQIDLPPGAELVTLLTATLDGMPLDIEGHERLDATRPRWRTETAHPARATQLDTGNVLLAPTPNATIPAGLTLSVAVAPRRASSSFPDWIAAAHYDALIDGATARLMLMPDRPWSAPKHGADRRARFEAAADNARAQSSKGLSRGPIRTTSHH